MYAKLNLSTLGLGSFQFMFFKVICCMRFVLHLWLAVCVLNLQQDRQIAFKVTLRRVRLTFVAVEKP